MGIIAHIAEENENESTLGSGGRMDHRNISINFWKGVNIMSLYTQEIRDMLNKYHETMNEVSARNDIIYGRINHDRYREEMQKHFMKNKLYIKKDRKWAQEKH